MASESRIHNPFIHPILFVFQLLQWLVSKILAPKPPGHKAVLARPRVAVIGAGITGVTSAAHCIGHGFDVVIFEAGGEDQVGGIWSVSADALPAASRLTPHRKSTAPPGCKSTPSCTDSIPR